jgi:MSHA biogenesis protein MshJ
MKAQWRKLADRYAALSRREQLLVAVATVALVGFLVFSVWVNPAASRAGSLRKQIVDQQADLAKLQAQVASLKAQLHDPDAANRKALAELQARLSGLDDQIGRLDDRLVPPERMGMLLQTVLAGHRGLALVSLRSLPPDPLITPPAEKNATGKVEPKTVKPSPAVAENIYRHGLEIRVAGGYSELLAYVAALERAPQRLLWGRMALAVTAYPRSELTLTVYTLSRDKDWLAV